MSAVVKQIIKAAKEQGIKVNKKKLCLKLFLQGHKSFGHEGGQLKEKQINKIKKFAASVLSDLKKL